MLKEILFTLIAKCVIYMNCYPSQNSMLKLDVHQILNKSNEATYCKISINDRVFEDSISSNGIFTIPREYLSYDTFNLSLSFLNKTYNIYYINLDDPSAPGCSTHMLTLYKNNHYKIYAVIDGCFSRSSVYSVGVYSNSTHKFLSKESSLIPPIRRKKAKGL